MQEYTLYDMIGLLRLECWKGGMVEKIGYVRGVEQDAEGGQSDGTGGLYISPHVRLERCEVLATGGCKAVFSIYNPFEGNYTVKIIETELSDCMALYSAIEDVINGKEDAPVWSYNTYKRNIYRTERRYETGNRSMRSGQIDRPHKSKIFRG